MEKVNLDAFKMSKAQMNNVNGGVSRKEYCQDLYDIVTNNSIYSDPGSTEGFLYGWQENECMDFIDEFQRN